MPFNIYIYIIKWHAPDELKSKLTAFVDAIGRIVKDFDGETWETWFSSHGKFADWVFFTASVFTPHADVYVGKDEASRIKNALEFFEKIQHGRLRGDKSKGTPSPVRPIAIDSDASTSRHKHQKRKFQEYDNGNGEDDQQYHNSARNVRKRIIRKTEWISCVKTEKNQNKLIIVFKLGGHFDVNCNVTKNISRVNTVVE